MDTPKRRSPTTLYRLYDRASTLLYAGVAGNPGRRFEQHAGRKPWWGEVAHADLAHFPDREQALLAERTSIATEHPRHNIVGRRPTIPLVPAGEGTWVFSSKQTGYERARDLRLYWECELSSMSGDWTADEITAYELLDLWIRELKRTESWDFRLGEGWVDIHWFVTCDGRDSVFEAAPFRPPRPSGNYDFLTHFTWPYHRITQDELNWLTLPVQDLAWNQTTANKGGFIQEAAGWKPSALQPHVYLPTLLHSIGR